MKRKAVTILMAAVLCAVFAASVSASESKPVKAIIYPLESSLYGDMDMLYALCGMARPSTNRPWSDAEARMILSRVDKAGLSGIAAELYAHIRSRTRSRGLRILFARSSLKTTVRCTTGSSSTSGLIRVRISTNSHG